jgi:hypothetical protein
LDGNTDTLFVKAERGEADYGRSPANNRYNFSTSGFHPRRGGGTIP